MKRALLIIIVFLTLPTQVFALPDRQKEVIDAGADLFNIEEGSCAPSDIIPSKPSEPLPSGASVYILGDSITNQSRTDIEAAMQGGSYTVTAINADPGRAISVDTAGSNPAGLQAVETDSTLISSSDAIVVALGTNSGTEDLSVQIPALVTAIREIKADISIYWVNLFYESGDGPGLRNAVITDQATKLNFRIIDTVDEGIELSGDQVHPTITGNASFAATMIAGLKSGGSTVIASPSNSGGYDPLSLTYPNFPDEAATGRQITAYLQEHKPSSPWLDIEADFGGWLVAEARTRNINPLLIMTIGRQENGFGTGSQTHVTQYFNYFGMKGSTPIDIPYSEYRGFSSPREGITSFMDTIKNNIEGGNPNYKDVTNYYEYQSMHQSGLISYPGEPLDPNDKMGPGGKADGNTQDGYDTAMDVYISWTVSDHPNNEYDGNTYNPGIYYKNSVGLINAMLGLTLSDVPVRGGSGLVLNCQTSGGGGSGKIDSSGYSFPLAPQTKAVGGIKVGQTETAHHDKTAAFDLFSTDSANVYAIYSGKAIRIVNDYHGVAGCSTIQFLADDGYYYWYGHLKEVSITEDTPVTAGQQIAKIADKNNFGSDCWGGGPHLHIDRGCTIDGVPQTGGRDECRDPDFIPFLAALYETLPE